jgi:hypothetical protein
MRYARLLQALFGLVLAVCLPLHSAWAQGGSAFETFVSRTGSDNGSCISTTNPCASFSYALSQTTPGGQINVLDAGDYGPLVISRSVSIVADGVGAASPCCGGAGGFSTGSSGVTGNALIIINAGASDTVTLRGLTVHGPTVLSNVYGIAVISGGNVSIEKTKLVGNTNTGIFVVSATGTINVSIDETSATGNAGGGIKIISPSSTTVNAAISRSMFNNNTGGGIRIDGSSGGTITASISDTTVSLNSGNGVNAIAGAQQNIVSIKNNVIAKNGGVGVQANGANAGVLLQSTLLDQNVAGATSIVNGGNMFTYANNSIVGSAGSGFNHSAGLQ